MIVNVVKRNEMRWVSGTNPNADESTRGRIQWWMSPVLERWIARAKTALRDEVVMAEIDSMRWSLETRRELEWQRGNVSQLTTQTRMRSLHTRRELYIQMYLLNLLPWCDEKARWATLHYLLVQWLWTGLQKLFCTCYIFASARACTLTFGFFHCQCFVAVEWHWPAINFGKWLLPDLPCVTASSRFECKLSTAK